MKTISEFVQETIDFMGRGFYEQAFVPTSQTIAEAANGGVDVGKNRIHTTSG